MSLRPPATLKVSAATLPDSVATLPDSAATLPVKGATFRVSTATFPVKADASPVGAPAYRAGAKASRGIAAASEDGTEVVSGDAPTMAFSTLNGLCLRLSFWRFMSGVPGLVRAVLKIPRQEGKRDFHLFPHGDGAAILVASMPVGFVDKGRLRKNSDHSPALQCWGFTKRTKSRQGWKNRSAVPCGTLPIFPPIPQH